MINSGRVRSRRIGKAHLTQFQLAADPFRQVHHAVLRRNDLTACGQQLSNPFRRARSTLKLTDHLTQGAKRTADDQAVKNERGQLTAGNPPRDHVHATHPKHHPHCTEHQHNDQGNQPGALQNAFARGVERRFDRHSKTTLVAGLMVVGLHGLDLPQGFGHITANIRYPVLALTRQATHPPTENQNRHQHQGQRQHHNAGQLRVGHEQQHNATHHHQGIAQKQRKRRADHRLQQRCIGGQPRLNF